MIKITLHFDKLTEENGATDGDVYEIPCSVKSATTDSDHFLEIRIARHLKNDTRYAEAKRNLPWVAFALAVKRLPNVLREASRREQIPAIIGQDFGLNDGTELNNLCREGFTNYQGKVVPLQVS